MRSTEFKTGEKMVLSKKISRVWKGKVFVVRLNAATKKTYIKLKLSSKGLKNGILKQSSDGLLEKCRKVLDDRVNNASTKRSFRTNDHTIVTRKQTK